MRACFTSCVAITLEVFVRSNEGCLCQVVTKGVKDWSHLRYKRRQCLSEELEIPRLEIEGSTLGLREFEAL